MTPVHVLISALVSAATAVLIQLAASMQTKTTVRATQSRPATRHVDPDRPRREPRDGYEEYPGRMVRPYGETVAYTQTTGAPVPPAGAPAHTIARHAAAASPVWADPSWPPATADDTHVTEAIT